MMFKGVAFPLLATKTGKIMFLLLGLVFLGSIGLDQVSKRHAQSTLMVWEHSENIKLYKSTFVPVITLGDEEGDQSYFTLRFNYKRNTGAAFSMLADLEDHYRVPFFYGITFIAVVFIMFYLKTLPLNYHLTRLGLVFMLSGALGNFMDRVSFGYVIDFFDTEWRIFGWQHDFAVFNVADVAINLGVICFILEALLRKKPLDLDLKGRPVLKSK